MSRNAVAVAAIRGVTVALVMVACVGVFAPAVRAQQSSAPPSKSGEQENGELAKQLSNPLASLVSVPFQFNWEQNVGPSKLTRFVLNVQPVMPFTLNADWNLIIRLIAPLVSQPPLADGGPAAGGISDITTSFFFAPTKLTKFILGYQIGFGAFPAHPAIGPSWKIRAAIVLLLPRSRT